MQRLKRLIVCSLFVFLSVVESRAFPTEPQVKSGLHSGMTPKEVAALFGPPNSGVAETCVDCTFRYVAPIGLRNVEREGYIGFVVDFRDGKATEWRIMTGEPSYAPPQMPWQFKTWLWFFVGSFVIGIVLKFLIRKTPVAWSFSKDVVNAFEAREIQAQQCPSEFRFITHDTTLQEVIDKVGMPTRRVKVAINPDAGLGYALASSGLPALILTFEYDLPYMSAVIVMPEFPFEPENRIRAVYYRPIQRELAEAMD